MLRVKGQKEKKMDRKWEDKKKRNNNRNRKLEGNIWSSEWKGKGKERWIDFGIKGKRGIKIEKEN